MHGHRDAAAESPIFIQILRIDMKKTVAFSLLLACLGPLFGQQIQEISTSTGYKKQSFVRLADGTEKQSDNTAWDIAFSVFGQQDAGIHVNEAGGSSMGQALPNVRVFDALTEDFADVLDPDLIEEFELFNPEKTWAFGAFNEGRDPQNPFDYGWGQYVPATNTVTGAKVFLVKLRDGSYRKMKIESLTAAAGYSFKYANLNGTGEVTKTIKKADFAGKTLAYFSFSTQNTVDVEPSGAPFDLLYTRYVAPVPDPTTGILTPYNVTGIISGRGVQVAKADGIAPATVQFSAWKDSLKNDISTIGYDWKTLAGTSWNIDDDRVYFVKTADQRVWKIQFVDFEGSSTGTAILEKTDLGIISSVAGAASIFESFDVFPNPATDATNLVFTAKTAAASGLFQLTDATGRTVKNGSIRIQKGLNAATFSLDGLSSGAYFLTIQADGSPVFGKTILVQR